jgi:lactase-phlorizin hydrolase
VKLWITFNEPWVFTVFGYGAGSAPPGMHGIGTYVYQAAHNVLRAHAKAYRIYQSRYQNQQGGCLLKML